MKNRTDHEKRKSGFTRKFKRCLASAACVVGVAAVCFGVAGYQNKIKADSNPEITRGVLDGIEEVPETKKTMFKKNSDDYMHTLGTKENPFMILEIVPYEEYASFGYHISGCEPVDFSENYGNKDAMSLAASMKTATADLQSGTFFFPDEPEANPDYYTGDKPREYWSKNGEAYEGYYEFVGDGNGTFRQKNDGTFSKSENGNIIWHTICNAEMEQLKKENKNLSFSEANSQYKKLENVGDRIYTKRLNTQEDPVYITYGYYYYQNKDDFLLNSLKLSKQDADNYSVIIKTITPEELNHEPEWADYADLYIVSRKDYMIDGSYKETNGRKTAYVWRKYNRLNHQPTLKAGETYSEDTDDFVNSASNSNRDISWEVVEKIFNKVTSDKIYAGMAMGSSMYKVDNACYNGAVLNDESDLQIYDWNLKPLKFPSTGKAVTIKSGKRCNNNIYKLMLMLTCMDNDIFKRYYMNDNDPLIKDGKFSLRTDEDVTYWSPRTFWLMETDDENVMKSPYEKYFSTDDAWSNYGILPETSTISSWVDGHFYSFNDDNSLTFEYEGASTKPDWHFEDYQKYLDEFYKEKGHGGTPADAVRYILGDRSKRDQNDKKELKILDIEPCYDSKLANEIDKETGKKGTGYTLGERYVRMMIPKYKGKITIKHMTTAEFIGSAEDLNSTYDLIFMGLDYGAYNTKQTDDGEFTTWNDSNMYGKIYFHTGDKMTGANYTNDNRSRSVEFLYSATEKDNVVKGQELRFSGNDITLIKKAELEDFLRAGHPIIAVPYLYKLDSVRIDQHSNIHDFINENKDKKSLLKTTDVNGIYAAIGSKEVSVDFTALPAIYNGDTGDSNQVVNPNYLPKKNGRAQMSFAFKVNDDNNKKYACRVYLDQNQDGKFTDDEEYYKSNTFSASAGTQTVNIQLSKLYYGLIQWKIEVYEVKNNENDHSVRFVKTGCSAVKNTTGTRKVINVLQIMPKGKDETYDGKLDLSNNKLFEDYCKDLKDYQVNITVESLDEFQKCFDKDHAFTYYDYSKELTDTDYDTISKKLSQKQQDLYKYNMYIIGFGDTYGGKNLDNTYGMVDFLKFYIASGKSVLFTHDLTSMHNTKDDNFGYSANTLLRDVMGMNRYKAISINVPDKTRMANYQNKYSYDTVKDVDGNSLKQTHGFTYYAMKRLGWTGVPKDYNADQKMPYKYMITSSETGNPICDIGEIVHTGFNNTNDITTQVQQSNQGQITEYPYKIDESFTISPTHGQWYQLDMEDPEVTVWYTLADDGVHKVCEETQKDDKGNIIYENGKAKIQDNNGDGTAVTYGVSPKDAANNYYIYSKGNVFYSGVGHSEIKTKMEAKLFVNTMIAAYRASYDPPMIEILNSEAEIVDTSTMNYSMSFNDEYNGDEQKENTDNTAENVAEGKENTTEGNEEKKTDNSISVEGKGKDNDDYIKIRFSPVELNAISTTLTCAIYYEDRGVTHYVQRIYDADTNAEIECSLKDGKCVYEGVKNMHEYYFYYPKKYLNDWKDGSTTKSARRTINFYIKNNKAKLPRYQTLDMSVRALFRLD